jgi:hypothetical protein
MTDTPEEPRLPPSLRFLKALVIVLMITMIVGVITVVGLLVTRMPDGNALVVPQDFKLPAGITAQTLTFGKGWVGVVTTDNHFMLFEPSGKVLQDVPLQLP